MEMSILRWQNEIIILNGMTQNMENQILLKLYEFNQINNLLMDFVG